VRSANRLLWTAAGLVLAGCETPAGPIHVQIIRYPEVAQPEGRPADCATGTILDLASAVPDGCAQFGDIFLGESGNTHPCTFADLREQLAKEACQAGADASRIVRVMEPQGGSSCYQLRAELFECRGDPVDAH
jgi:hypothetical protein